ncbi:leucine-rich repeat-containing protein 18-like [Watersipora subatra]|uniref:leucine-rich repeat-containing protein 18-like n=1 Tax=Watersipora subatra TaxID=2589382 RepID=UPI00355AD45F
MTKNALKICYTVCGIFMASALRFDSLTNLKELDISSNKLDSESLFCMEKPTLLEKLDLHSCDVKKPPFSFDLLTNLKELNISSNKLDPESLVGIEKLPLLEKLNLRSCDMKELPFCFKRLNNLRVLLLLENDFEEYPSVLRSLPEHIIIDIREFKFSKAGITRVFRTYV